MELDEATERDWKELYGMDRVEWSFRQLNFREQYTSSGWTRRELERD